MKTIQKTILVQLRGQLASLNVVGLPTEKVKALLRLNRKAAAVAEEINAQQKELIEKYDIKVAENGHLDTQSEHFGEYVEVYQSLLTEEIDLAEFCILTEDEAIIATSKIDAPLAVVDALCELLTKAEPKPEPKAEE
ncbi:MAG: hypothetical protein J6U49_04995 [Alistipes sp.]|nr:hypothetical protein [Alistipes sp.]